MRPLFPLAIALSLSALSACTTGAQFTTQTAPGFSRAPHTISVLGVYKDGRMGVGSWDKVAPHLVNALGSAPCELAFDALLTSNQELADAIDERARNEGPTSDLLARLAPAARGDLLMVVMLAGKLPQRQTRGEPPAGAPVSNSMVTQRKGRRQAQSAAGGARDPNRLEVSASLFSVKENRPVALVSMTYGGQSVEDALTRFGAELALSIPNSKCVGWNWDVKIDPATLRSFDVK
ncbi:MAG: hypothetical protein ABW061_03330 [Polyangiaceae bacterium]